MSMADVPAAPAALEAYLLGRVGFEALLAWQRRSRERFRRELIDELEVSRGGG